LCIKLVLIKELYYDARPNKSQEMILRYDIQNRPEAYRQTHKRIMYLRGRNYECFLFNVHGSVHRNNILVYKSQFIAFSAEYTLFNDCNFNLIYRYSLSVNLTLIYYSVTVIRCCSYSCFVLLKMGVSDARTMQSHCQIQ